METHYLNEGRESLFTLDTQKLYLIEGNASGIFSTMKNGVSRYALSDVLSPDSVALLANVSKS